jgi:hypothetical protein
MNTVIPTATINSLMEYLNYRKKILESMIKTFEIKYGSLEKLKEKIEKEGVPEDDHTIWDDLIMWENLDSELKKINNILEGLKTCSIG